MQLILLRHGDALPHEFDDAARPLSALGEQQAVAAGQTLLKLKMIPSLVLSSPLTRAEQTTRIVTKEIGVSSFDTIEYLTPTSDPRQLVEELNRRSQSPVLLIGHLPSIQIFASLLTTGSRQSAILFSTGTMIAIDSPDPLTYGKGTMTWSYTYDKMKKLNAAG
jgi:phosphohistidine phosphatase SixA